MFSKEFFDQPVHRVGTNCAKWDNRAMLPENGVPLWVADMDFACAPAIMEALVKRAEHPVYGYPLISEESDNAVIDFWKRRHQVSLRRSEMLMMPSVVSGLRATVMALTAPDDKVLIMPPVYGPFFSAVKDSSRRLVEVPLQRDEAYRYHINFSQVEEELRQGAKLVMVCSPHNPVSRLWSKEELKRVSDLCAQYGAYLAVDEIHCDFVYKLEHFTSIFAVEGIPSTTICMTAASKTFNIAGLKQAYLFCRDGETLQRLKQHMEINGVESGNVFALAGTQAAYTHGDAWLDGLMDYLFDNRQVVIDTLGELLPLAHISPIEATFLAWVDVSAYEMDNSALEKRCYEHKVALTTGTFFGKKCGQGFMRVNFGCPRAQLIKGLERFARAVQNK